MENELFAFLSKYMTLTDDEKQAIIDLDIFRNFKKGTVLLEEGQRSREGYFVLKGCMRTYYMIDGEEKTTSFYTEMEGLTPNCVLTNSPSEYYVSCIEDSILLVANPDIEEETFNRFPRFETLCRIFSEDLLAKKQISFDEYKTSTPEERYLNLLENRPELLQRVPLSQLASFLGITPQSLSRLRARLSEQKKS